MAKKAVFKSTRELGAAIGVSHVTVGNWMKDERWRFGGFPIGREMRPAIQSWSEAELRPANEPGNAAITDPKQLGILKQAQLQKLIEEGRLKKIERQREEGQLHRVDECRARSVQQLSALKQAFRSIPSALPFQSDVKDLVLGRIDEVFRSLSRINEEAMAYTEMAQADLQAALKACAKRWGRRTLDPAAIHGEIVAAFDEAVKKRCA